MKATKPEKHLLLPVRSSNIRNHIVNLPATLLLRGGFVIYPRCSRIINSLLHVIILPFVAFHPPLAVFCSPFVAFRFLFAAFYPSFVAFLLPFFISCLPFMYVLLQVVLSVLFVSVFSFITNTLFCWKSKKVENFSLLQNKRNCLFGKEKDL